MTESETRWETSDQTDEDRLERYLYIFVKNTNAKQGAHYRRPWSLERLYCFAACLRHRWEHVQPPISEGMDFVAEFQRLYPVECSGAAITEQNATQINRQIRQACPLQDCDPVEVRVSPRGGYGLFATRFIKKHERITAYIGEHIEYDDLEGFEWDYSYVWSNSSHSITIDAIHPYQAGYGGYINDALDAVEHMESANNVNCRITSSINGVVWVRANKDIEPGEELLTAYGAHFWRCFLCAEALSPELYEEAMAAYANELLSYPDTDIDIDT